jgi:hypothetical protein
LVKISLNSERWEPVGIYAEVAEQHRGMQKFEDALPSSDFGAAREAKAEAETEED